jgi:hypothetical protein
MNSEQKNNNGLGRNFRLIYNGECVEWRHIAEITESDKDLTGMTDEEFEEFIRKINGNI